MSMFGDVNIKSEKTSKKLQKQIKGWYYIIYTKGEVSPFEPLC
jgi:hypothetical protein